MNIEAWFRVCCPKCDKSNWINQGDITDTTVYEPDAVECHACSHKFLLDEDIFISDHEYALLEAFGLEEDDYDQIRSCAAANPARWQAIIEEHAGSQKGRKNP
jgi:hypothetical protein